MDLSSTFLNGKKDMFLLSLIGFCVGLFIILSFSFVPWYWLFIWIVCIFIILIINYYSFWVEINSIPLDGEDCNSKIKDVPKKGVVIYLYFRMLLLGFTIGLTYNIFHIFFNLGSLLSVTLISFSLIILWVLIFTEKK